MTVSWSKIFLESMRINELKILLVCINKLFYSMNIHNMLLLATKDIIVFTIYVLRNAIKAFQAFLKYVP